MDTNNQDSISKENLKKGMEKWETPVLLELDTSRSQAMNFTDIDDGDSGPKPS